MPIQENPIKCGGLARGTLTLKYMYMFMNECFCCDARAQCNAKFTCIPCDSSAGGSYGGSAIEVQVHVLIDPANAKKTF